MMTLKRAALAASILLAFVSGASAQTTEPKSTLLSEVLTQIPDNQSNAITPANVRRVFNDAIASYQQAPQVNAQTGTSYTFLVSDYGNLVTFNNASAVAVTLPQATGSFNPWNVYVLNKGTGTVTITPQGGSLIGGASSFAIPGNASAFIVSDGTNYQVGTGTTNSNLANMAGGTTKCREGGAVTGAPTDCTNPIVALDDFGCAGNGSTDDTTCINNAIAALPAAGGRIYATPGKNYCITSSINIGNGSTSAQSTTSGVHIFSTGSWINFSGAPQTQITWCGSSSANAMFNILGPYKDWGFENIVLNCNALAGTGLKLIAASYGKVENLMIESCNNQQLLMNSLATAATGSPNTQFNQFRDLQIYLPNTANAIGMVLDGDGTNAATDTNLNVFHDTIIVFPSAGATTLTGLVLRNADTNYFYGFEVFANGTNAGTTMVVFDYSATGSSGVYPSGNQFFGAEIKGISTFAGTTAANIGTPGGSAHANTIYGLSEVNTAVCPTLNNLACYSARQLVMAPNGNVAPTDLMGAWTATFTPTPTCGSATITTNTARSKVMGKTTFVQLDITITALGTCTNSFTFTLPNTSNSGGGLVGRQTAGSGNQINCFITSASATANCAATSNFTANQIVLSGVYENQ